MKKCSKCGEEKELSEFNKRTKSKDGYNCACKICDKNYRENNKDALREKRKQRILENREVILSKRREDRKRNNKEVLKKEKIYRAKTKDKKKRHLKVYREINKEELALKRKEYRLRTKEHRKEQQREYYLNNKEKIDTRKKEYYKNNKERLIKKGVEASNQRKKRDPNFKLTCNLRCRLLDAVKNQGGIKSSGTFDLLGCSAQEVRTHLEKQFKEGMSWENHGVFGWHIDHIIPCTAFDLTDPEQQKLCFHYSNLQPLWREENLKKGNKILE